MRNWSTAEPGDRDVVKPPLNNGYIPPGSIELVPQRRKMEIEWFDEAARAALEEPANPLIDGVLDEGTMSVIYGDSNSGKTFVALDMAFSVSTGALWNGNAVKRGLVVYIAAEGGKRIRRRLAALRKRYHDVCGANAAAPLFALIRFPIDLRSNDANLVELIGLIRAAEAQIGEACVWIIVDTLSRAMAGGDENSPVDMGRIVAAADRIRTETSAHFTYIHHTGKDAARGARGHSLLRAATDTEIEVTPQSMTVTKQRDMEGGLTLRFTLVDLEIGINLEDRPVRSAIVEWQEGHANPVEAKPKRNIPASMRMLMEVIIASIEEAGLDVAPWGDKGVSVRAAPDEPIRNRYFARMAEKAEKGEDASALYERQRKSFTRAIAGAINQKLIMAADLHGSRHIWLP